jgi:hypothetical protein
MVKSYYRCECGGRVVTVWPSVTEESGFYDVVFGDVGDEAGMTTVTRLTVTEAAAYVITELGAPVATTLDILSGMIRRWREEYEAEAREMVRNHSGNQVVTS